MAFLPGSNWVSAGNASASTTTQSSVGPATKLVFTTQPVGNVAEGTNFSTSPVVKVEDASNNVVTTDTGSVTLAINSGPAAGALTCSNPGFPTVTAVAGVATFTNCQITGTAAAGTYTLSATRAGLTSTGASSNVVINAGPANKLAFTSAPVAGQQATTTALGPLTVEVEDSFGNPVTGARTVNLSSTGTPKFATTQNVSGTTTLALSIPAGSSSASFFYGNNTAGTPTITATSTSPTTIAQTTQNETVGANKLVITTAPVSGAASSSAGLGPITVQLQNAAGTPVNATSNITVSLASSSTGTKIFSGTSGGSSATSVTVTTGTSSKSFFYGDTLAGTPTITVSASGLTSGTQQKTITSGAFAGLALANCVVQGNAQACNGSYKLGNGGTMEASVRVVDQFGNDATIPGTLTLSVTSGNTSTYAITAGATLTIDGTATPPNESTGTFTVDKLSNASNSTTITVHVTSGASGIPDLTFTVQK